MTMSTEDRIATDLFYSDRFDRRILRGMMVLLALFPFFLAGHAVIDGRLETMVPHLLTWVMACVIVATSRDAISCILFSGTFWMFIYMLYIYQTLAGQHVDYGLFNAERAALLILVCQAGLLLAHFLSPRRPALDAEMLRRHMVRRETVDMLEPLLLTIGVLAILSSAMSLLPAAITSPLIFFLYAFIGTRASHRRETLHKDLLFLGALGAVTIVAVLNNSRGSLFDFLFAAGFLMLLYRRQVITLRLVLLCILAIPLLDLFSDAILIARSARHSEAISVTTVFMNQFFTWETLLGFFDAFKGGDTQTITLEELAKLSQFHSPVYGPDRNSGLLGRLTPLPHMDIVTARLPDQPAYTDWDTFWRITGSVLPSIGQQKELIYSDKVVWDLGLRNRLSLMRPMITAQGELFSIGGYMMVAVVPAICFWSMNLMYRAMVRLTMNRAVVIVIMSQLLITSQLSTTLLSMMSTSTREPLLFMAVLAVLMWLADTFSTRRQRPPPRPHPAE